MILIRNYAKRIETMELIKNEKVKFFEFFNIFDFLSSKMMKIVKIMNFWFFDQFPTKKYFFGTFFQKSVFTVFFNRLNWFNFDEKLCEQIRNHGAYSKWKNQIFRIFNILGFKTLSKVSQMSYSYLLVSIVNHYKSY